MTKILVHPLVRVTCWYLVLTIALSFAPAAPAWASFITSNTENGDKYTDGDQLSIQIQLENTYIAERLSFLGLSAADIERRLLELSAEERLILLKELENIQVGGLFEGDTTGEIALKILAFTIGFIIGYSLVSSSSN